MNLCRDVNSGTARELGLDLELELEAERGLGLDLAGGLENRARSALLRPNATELCKVSRQRLLGRQRVTATYIVIVICYWCTQYLLHLTAAGLMLGCLRTPCRSP